MTTSIPSFRAVTLVDGTVTTSTAPVRAVVLSAVALSIVGGGLAWRHRQRAQQPAPQEESGDGDGWFTSGPSKLFDPTSTMGHPRSSQGTGAATDEAQGVSSVPGLRSSRPGPSSSFWTPAIHQRTRALHFVRSMLGQMSGVIFESSDDDGSATDVSLNCKIAVEIEERAREDLIDAIDIFETALEEQEMRTADNPAVSEELAYILTKAAEYLDISNEREKLELRRVALYQERGEDCEEQEVVDEWDEIDDDDEGELDGLQGNLFTGPASTSAPLPFASEMDRLLHAAALAGLNAPEEVFEDEWEPEEAEGPRYAARRGRGFASLPPRAASRDESPDSDFRIVAADGRDFADVLKDLRPRRQDPAEESSESMEDFEEGTGDFEERGGVWTVARKVAFEEELMDRINLIALDLGMTSTEGDWKEVPLQMSKGDKKHAPPRGRANDRHNTGEDEEWEAASDSEDDAPMEEQPSAAVKPKKRLRLKSSR